MAATERHGEQGQDHPVIRDGHAVYPVPVSVGCKNCGFPISAVRGGNECPRCEQHHSDEELREMAEAAGY